MHVWFNILGDLGCLHLDQQIAAAVNASGIGLMLLSFAWGFLMLFKQYQTMKGRQQEINGYFDETGSFLARRDEAAW
jgi:hypothetical protein